MADKRSAQLLCPHCGQGITLSTRKSRVKKEIDWSAVDWATHTGELAKALGVPIPTVSMARRKHAPETCGMNPRAKVDWGTVDWSRRTRDLVTALGVGRARITEQRKRYAPETMRGKQ